ncbi:MAG TPA: tetratricopeptide repeat protein [Chloroflexia bacterium]|nr:tetratricopeptide repeat protein [Chloroflexia bacterium]
MLIRVAVVAGCNYTGHPAGPADEPRPRALHFAEADAQAMADLLKEQGFAVSLLLGRTATRAGILTALRTQSRLAGADDGLLVFYFAGHGGPDPAAPNRAYLIPADADPADLPTTALELEHLATYLPAAGRTLTLLDCCYSAPILGNPLPAAPAAGPDSAPQDQARPAAAIAQEFGARAQATLGMQPGHLVIAACAANEQTRELPRFGHGVFTYYVLAHWRDHPGEVSYGSLVHYLDTMLEKAGLPRVAHGDAGHDRLVLRAGAAPGRAVLHVPYPRNPRFVGRADVLAQLNTLLHTHAVVALTGASGIGKTELACEFAYRNREQFPGGVFWLAMDPPEGIATQIAAYAGPAGLNLPGAGARSFDQRIAAVRANWDHPLPSLLIFDNLAGPAVLDQWRPRGPGARVLITSRRQTWAAHRGIEMLALDGLTRPAGRSLLLTPRARRQGATVAPLLATNGPLVDDELCEELGDFPLALALAAAYLEAHPDRTLSDYLAAIRTQALAHASLDDFSLALALATTYLQAHPGRTLGDYLAEVRTQVLAHDLFRAALEEPLPTEHAAGIVATFALSYNELLGTTPSDTLARTLLHRAAHAAATPIPRALLPAVVDLDPADPVANQRLDTALRRLAGLGLVDTLPDGSARLHRLLAAYARSRAPDPGADAAALERALTAAAYQLLRAGNLQAAQVYLPHLRAATTAAMPRTDLPAATLLNNLASLLRAQGDYAAARPLYERALVIAEQTLGPTHPDTAGSLTNLASLLQAQGDYAAARPLHERALAIAEQTLGPTHPDTATSLNYLAGLLYGMGDYAGARPLYERALAIAEQTLGPSHPATVSSLDNLANLLSALDDYGGARPLLERALAIREQTLGPAHLQTAQSLNNLASLLYAQGDYAAARPLYERVLAIREQTLGPTHPDTATSLNYLASLLQAQGEPAAARALYERALAIAEQTLGPTHPTTAACLNNLAALLRGQGDPAAARPLLERGLTIAEQTLGPTHPATAISLNNLAELLQAQGDPGAARPLYERALVIAEQALGPTHPTTRTIRQNLHSL